MRWPIISRAFGLQSACAANSGSIRLAASISCPLIPFGARARRMRSYAIPDPWWMPSSIASRLQMSSRIVPRDERAMRRKRGMMSRSKKTCMRKTFSSSESASRNMWPSVSRCGSRSPSPPTCPMSLSHASVWRDSSCTIVE